MDERLTRRQIPAGRPLAAAASLLVLAALGAAGAKAQNPPPVVTAQTFLASTAAHAGTAVQAAVVAQIASGYHINDHHPSLEYLIPTVLELQPAAHLSVTKTVYPKGRLMSFSFSDTQLSVYEGTLRVGAVLVVARGTPPGEYPLEGKLHYQACNDHACLPPASVPIAFNVKVVSRRVAVQPANPEIFKGITFE
jgi:Thiol:disulfide interchange protein DsbD, N-terminal